MPLQTIQFVDALNGKYGNNKSSAVFITSIQLYHLSKHDVLESGTLCFAVEAFF